MLKKIMYLLLFALSLSSAGAEIPTATNKIDADSLKQGEWVVLYNAFEMPVDDPAKAETYTVADYKDGKVQGKVSVYWITGELKAEYHLLSEEPFIYDGEYVDYYKNGQVKSKGLHKEGEETGEWEHYFDDGSIDSSVAIYQKACEFYFQGNFAEALPLHKKALQIRKEKLGDKNWDYLGILHDISTTNYNLGNLEEALRIMLELQQAVKETYGVNNPRYLQGLYDLASYYSEMENFKESEKFMNEYMDIVRVDPGKLSMQYVKGLEKLAYINARTNRIATAIPLTDSAISIRELISQDKNLDYANTVYYKGDLLKLLGRFEEGIQYYEKSLEIIKSIAGELHPNYIAITSHMSMAYSDIGQNAKAEALLIKAKGLAEQVAGPGLDHYGMIPYYLGNLYNSMGRYSEAEPLIKQALEIDKRETGGNDLPEAYNTWTLAILYSYMGRFNEAETTMKKALKLLREILGEQSIGFAKCQVSLADILQNMGRYAEAEELLLESISIMDAIFEGDHPEKISIYNILSTIYSNTGRKDKSIQINEKALQSTINIYGPKHPTIPIAIGNLATLYSSLNKEKIADSLFKVSIALMDEIPGVSSRNILKIKTSYAWHFEKLHKYDEALSYLSKIPPAYKELLGDMHPDYIRSIFHLARYYMHSGAPKKSQGYFTDCINRTFALTDRYFPSLSESEKMQFWNTVSDRLEQFNSYAASYYKENPEILKYMYNYSLLSKGLILEAKKKSLSKARGMSKLLKHWQQTREYWMKLIQNPEKAKQMGVDIDSVENAANEYEKLLSSQSMDMKKNLDTTKVRWQDIRKMLKKNQAAVEIIRFRNFEGDNNDNVYYAALILRNREDNPIEIVVLKNGNDIENLLLKQYAKHIQKQKNKGFSGLEDYLLKEIYNQIWSEIDKKLDGIETIYLSPDGVFNKINLNTLINPETGKFLIDELNIHLMTSTRDLSDKSKFKVYGNLMMPDNNAVLFGNPAFNLNYIDDGDMDSQELYAGTSLKRVLSASMERGAITPLPGTEKEINLISEQLNNKHWKTETFFGKNALEKNIKSLESPKILHIATHGVFLEDLETEKSTLGIENERYIENPLLRSMLLFAGSARTISGATGGDSPERDLNDINGGSWGEDGILTAYEVINLDLEGTELVVLSACKTGLGEVKNGEGVYGLQRAFQVAGAKTIIMSLWSVDDKTTQELMTSFYEKWLSGMNKRQAFNKAQAEMKGKYSQPYYWGAFVMVGE